MNQLTPLYPVACGKCNREKLLSFSAMTFTKVTHCQCYESIRLADQYRRSELDDIAERLGIPRNFFGFNDDQSGEIPERDS